MKGVVHSLGPVQRADSFYTWSWAFKIDGTLFLVAGGSNVLICVINVGNVEINKSLVGHGGAAGARDVIIELKANGVEPDPVWSWLESFAEERATELKEEWQAIPDLILGNYNEGNLVASLLALKLVVNQHATAHDLQQKKHSNSDMNWNKFENQFHLPNYGLGEGQALILTPTREVAQRIKKIMQYMGDYLVRKVHTCVGGARVHEDQRIFTTRFYAVVLKPDHVFIMFRRSAPSSDHIDSQSKLQLLLFFWVLFPQPHSSVNGFSKVKGVNLGGWLVVEGWIKPSLFDGIPNGDMLDGTKVQLRSVTLGKYEMNTDIYSSLMKALSMSDKQKINCCPVRASAAGAIATLLELKEWILQKKTSSSLIFPLLSNVVDAGKDNIAIHIPFVVSRIAASISKHLPPAPDRWPQVVERGFAALVVMAQTWDESSDEFRQHDNRCYMKLHDSPLKSGAEEENEMSKLDPLQKRKLRQNWLLLLRLHQMKLIHDFRHLSTGNLFDAFCYFSLFLLFSICMHYTKTLWVDFASWNLKLIQQCQV
ncbi:hypothetical protein J5N97_016290 [Dioscorea zingiberensis]|uniref:sucrose synthase n=1 Tax=Dioscorea zingiberensis TaxID=325984 RepID=A0A9D5HFA2_9LILI|nr:hypothetical protein J5N97_016290 [Dioscorea zingiberensis]